MINRLRRSKLRKNSAIEITLTPLIDTALVLLVIFMVATPVMHNAIKVDLPKGQAQEDESVTDDLTVYIDRNENIFLNKDRFSLEDLIKNLEKKVLNKRTQKIYVNADKTVSYGTLVKVVDRIKYIGGIEHVILSTEKSG